MKVITVLGTRPEIIRLSRVMSLLDESCNHKVVFTGQNYTKTLSSIFFEELGIRDPDYWLETKGSSTIDQIGKILFQVDEIFEKEKPDKVLILGDTNSALVSYAAKRKGIKVYHMEAGNRCFDDRVPEEVNRRMVDHSSDILLPYTSGSRDNLIREGIHPNRVYVTGNPIYEVIKHYEKNIDSCKVLDKLGLKDKQYFLVTLHRSENVDLNTRLHSFLKAFSQIQAEYNLPVVISLHPRTRSKIEASDELKSITGLTMIEPVGFFDFVKLEKHAKALLSDSGTVQEEGAILGIPTITLRDVTERPETLEAGSNILTGADPKLILDSLRLVLGRKGTWKIPEEYLAESVSHTVVNIIMSFRLT